MNNPASVVPAADEVVGDPELGAPCVGAAGDERAETRLRRKRLSHRRAVADHLKTESILTDIEPNVIRLGASGLAEGRVHAEADAAGHAGVLTILHPIERDIERVVVGGMDEPRIDIPAA